MKNLTTAIVFIFTGILILMKNLGYELALNRNMLDYWPVILVLIGLSYISLNIYIKILLKIISGIVISIILYLIYLKIFYPNFCL
jgi:hypothetical protein